MRRFLRYTRTIAIDVKFFCWKYHSWEFWKNQRDRHGGEVYGGGEYKAACLHTQSLQLVVN